MSLSKISQKLKVDQLFRQNGNRPAAPRKPKTKFLLVGVEDKLQKYMQAVAGKDSSEFTTAPDTDRALKLLKTRPYHMLVVASPHVDPGKVIGDKLLSFIKENRLARRITFLSSDEASALMPKIEDMKRGKGKDNAVSVKRMTRFRRLPLTTQHIYQVVTEVARNPFELPKVTLLGLMGFNDRLRLSIAGVFSIALALILLTAGGESGLPPFDESAVHRVTEDVDMSGSWERQDQGTVQRRNLRRLEKQWQKAMKDRDLRPKGDVRPGPRWGEDQGQ